MTVQPKAAPANRLIRATSPYLLQHAHNPVDWYEWGEEAFALARRDQKPVFLSIGYAACHWCHVMEHESFEHEDVAEMLNASFVSIKVDREERPDIDEIYMAYTQARTRHGGWPMSVWLTPEGTPFFAGTYFPKDQFKSVLSQITEIWNHRREQISQSAQEAVEFFKEWSGPSVAATDVPPIAEVDAAASSIARVFDRALGGMSGGRNKFPPSMAMELMLRVHRRTGHADLLEAVEVTLDHMARGGIYDHVGGGICRYSTDPEWLVPHFEKMLYDQAMVSSIYLDAFQVTKNLDYAELAKDIFQYVMADLQSPQGGFFSSRDADSDGLEGAFYIWTVEQIHEALGNEEEAQLCCAYYDVTPTGNWFESMGHAPRGPKSVLHVSKPPAAFARLHNMSAEELKVRVTAWRNRLLSARTLRTQPGLDDKILSAWNGLMIASLAKGARVLDEARFADAAAKAADFVLTSMRREGRLLRTSRQGEARLAAYLEDYAFMIEGLLNLYEATFERRWLDEAIALNERAIQYYSDDEGGGFFFTASDAEKLVARTKNSEDSAIPSGNSVQALNLLRLAKLLNRKDLRQKAESTFRCFAGPVGRSPYAFERHLCALDFYHDRVKEIAIIGDVPSADTFSLIRATFGSYIPNKIVMHSSDRQDETPFPLLKGKGRVKGAATAYVCENYTCQLPVTSPEQLASLLERGR